MRETLDETERYRGWIRAARNPRRSGSGRREEEEDEPKQQKADAERRRVKPNAQGETRGEVIRGAGAPRKISALFPFSDLAGLRRRRVKRAGWA